MFTLDTLSKEPIYLQLKNKIIKLSVLGVLSDNEPLPSVRSLAREIGVNPNTVQKAYQELERENIIYSIVGNGSFVSPRNTIVREIKLKAKDDLKESIRIAKKNLLTKDDVFEIVDNVFLEDDTEGGKLNG